MIGEMSAYLLTDIQCCDYLKFDLFSNSVITPTASPTHSYTMDTLTIG